LSVPRHSISTVSTTPTATTPRLQIWAALGVVYVVWGSTYLGIRWTIATIPPVLSAGVRFAVAGLLMSALVVIFRGRGAWRVTSAQARHGAVCGLLLLFGGNGLVVVAETRVPSGLAALLLAAVPLWLIVLRRLAGERVPGLTYVGVIVGLGGAALLFLPGGHGGGVNLWYAGLVLIAALSWSVGSMLSTQIAVPADPLVFSAIEMLAGGLALLLLAAVRGEFAQVRIDEISTRSWLSLAYLVVFGSIVAFSAYVWVFAHAPTSLVATYAYVNPVVAVALGVVLAGETLTVIEVVGAAVIVLAVVVVVTAEGRGRATALARAGPSRASPAPARELCEPA